MAKFYVAQFGQGNPLGYTGLSPTFIQFWNMTTGTTNTPPSISETVASKTGLYSFTFGATQAIAFVLDAATAIPGRYVIGQLDPADRADEYGNTMIALGQTMVTQATNIGTTLVAFGNTSVSLGNTAVALGMTGGAFGATNNALLTNMGSTLVGIGATQFAYGASLVSGQLTLTAYALTLTALGQSSMVFSFLGSTASSIGSTSADPNTVFGFLMRAQELAEGNNTYTKATGILDLFTRGGTLLREKTIADSSTQTTKT